MARYKDNAQLNTRIIRINLPTYQKLKGWCGQFNRTMAELIDLAVKLLDRELYIKPLFSVAEYPTVARAQQSSLVIAVKSNQAVICKGRVITNG